ncbi:hypothetical protein CRM22_007600 [Opisthorchis felineus]|nr:hypothetical protein CRM22_007600 [Opisthorchis felineus]
MSWFCFSPLEQLLLSDAIEHYILNATLFHTGAPLFTRKSGVLVSNAGGRMILLCGLCPSLLGNMKFQCIPVANSLCVFLQVVCILSGR